MLLSIAEEPIEGENAWRNEIMWFKQVQVLPQSAQLQAWWNCTDIMVDA